MKVKMSIAMGMLFIAGILFNPGAAMAQSCTSCPANPNIEGPAEVLAGELAVYQIAPHAGREDASFVTWEVENGQILTSENNNHRITVQWLTAGSHEVSVRQDPALIFPPYLMPTASGEDSKTVEVNLPVLGD